MSIHQRGKLLFCQNFRTVVRRTVKVFTIQNYPKMRHLVQLVENIGVTFLFAYRCVTNAEIKGNNLVTALIFRFRRFERYKFWSLCGYGFHKPQMQEPKFIGIIMLLSYCIVDKIEHALATDGQYSSGNRK